MSKILKDKILDGDVTFYKTVEGEVRKTVKIWSVDGEITTNDCDVNIENMLADKAKYEALIADIDDAIKEVNKLISK